jgi:hypothetical protein
MTTVRIDIDGQMSPNATKAIQPTMPGALIGHMSETEWKAWVDSVDGCFAPLNGLNKKYKKWFVMLSMLGCAMCCLGALHIVTFQQPCEEPNYTTRSGVTGETKYVACEETNYGMVAGLIAAGTAVLIGVLVFRMSLFNKHAWACFENVKKTCEEESRKHGNMTFMVKEEVQVMGKTRARFMFIEVSVASAAAASTAPVQAVVLGNVWQPPGALDAIPPADTDDTPEKMAALKKMFDGGLINEEEYEKKKAELLERM